MFGPLVRSRDVMALGTKSLGPKSRCVSTAWPRNYTANQLQGRLIWIDSHPDYGYVNVSVGEWKRSSVATKKYHHDITNNLCTVMCFLGLCDKEFNCVCEMCQFTFSSVFRLSLLLTLFSNTRTRVHNSFRSFLYFFVSEIQQRFSWTT